MQGIPATHLTSKLFLLKLLQQLINLSLMCGLLEWLDKTVTDELEKLEN